jgi:hypothetical protein
MSIGSAQTRRYVSTWQQRSLIRTGTHMDLRKNPMAEHGTAIDAGARNAAVAASLFL